VVDMANRAGMNYKIHPTPAVALGAYEITALEAAQAYTLFANQGERITPSFLSVVRSQDGKTVYKNKIEREQALDPRVAYLMTNLLEEVLRSGTAGGVRARYNLDFPVAGKTGTSHDGWFAGYTSRLLCVVWVGFDDNRELDLEGAHSAAPIWAEFMKRASGMRGYREVEGFPVPGGIVSVTIDPASGMPATSACPGARAEVYIAGTEPVGTCPLHGGGRNVTTVSGWDAAAPQDALGAPAGDTRPRVTGSGGDGSGGPANGGQRRALPPPGRQTQLNPAPTPAPPKKEEKPGVWRRIMGVFK
jgi:penicillin-binding protein 1B